MSDPEVTTAPAETPCSIDADALCRDIQKMVRYALQKGKEVPESALAALSAPVQTTAEGRAARLDALLRAHAALSSLVAPATALTISSTESNGKPAGIGDIKLLRQMMWAGGLSALGFIVLTVAFPDGAPATPAAGGLAGAAAATQPFAEQATYLFAAALGASFFGLFCAHRYVVERTFDPSYSAEYWVRFALGVIAGLALANVIQTLDDDAALSLNVVAILGGYSADAVNRILTRLVETLEALVAGRGEAMVADQKREIEAKARLAAAKDQLGTASQIMAVAHSLAGAAGNDEAKRKLKELADELLDKARA